MPDDAVRSHLHHLSMRGLSATTIDHRQKALTRLEFAITKPLLEATAADLAAWRAGLGDLASVTIADYLSHVRVFYAWATARGYLETDPAIGLPVPKVPRRIPRPISEAELMEALEQAPLRVRTYLVLAGWCGLRAKEIALLRGENIMLHATPPILLIAWDATKGRTERTIPLSAFAAAELTGLAERGLVFRKINGQPMPPNLVSKLSNQHLHDCGIPATLHQLRHRFGTMTYHVSHDLRSVQELMGHSSPATTAGYAAHDRAQSLLAVNGLPVPRLASL